MRNVKSLLPYSRSVKQTKHCDITLVYRPWEQTNGAGVCLEVMHDAFPFRISYSPIANDEEVVNEA